MGKLDWRKRAYAAVLLCATAPIALSAQTLKTLHSFDGTDGANPSASLVQATNGNLYGTTVIGGASTYCDYGCGTVFKITPSGTLTTLHSFDYADGEYPNAGLVQAANGDFYGTTVGGGANNGGTVFKITPGGTLTTLYSFCSRSGCTDGQNPYAGLVQAAGGSFYGTTAQGGVRRACAFGCGTVFKITPSGALTTLQIWDGAYPKAPLVEATNGNLYGTTTAGGAVGAGTVFRITPSDKLTTLYSFCLQGSPCTDGSSPNAGLVQATDGNFYGTTSNGGANDRGTVFKITQSGTLTTLYSFCSQSGCTDGNEPAALIQGTDGNFYGTTYQGGGGKGCGRNYCGTIFKITPSGTLTTLYDFHYADGANPQPALVQDTNGNFYGTTANGGAKGNYGTVFSLSVGLGPFVETQPAQGKVGRDVNILGTNLTGATSVSFSGTAAVFKVGSSSLITTTVPAGAATGTVQVVTPGATLSSNVPFGVRPVILSFSPTSGPVGTAVTITGDSLTQTTRVAFDWVNAPNFTVDSDTQVTVTVPAGATTGHIQIGTPGATGVSAGTFTVTP